MGESNVEEFLSVEWPTDPEERRARREHAMRLIERLKADKTFMNDLRETMERRARGEDNTITFEELERIIREREASSDQSPPDSVD